MPIRSLALLSSLLALAACASNPADPAPPDQAAAEMECSTETPIGSLVAKRVCRQKMTPEERQRIQDELGQKVRPTASGMKG